MKRALLLTCISLYLTCSAHAEESGANITSETRPAAGSTSKTEGSSKPTVSPTEDSSAPTMRTGFSANLGGSLATCLPSGTADCSGTFPGGSISSALEFRFWYMGIALEFDYGAHWVGGDGAENVSNTTMHLIPVLKGYYPLGDLELFFGAGLGYSSITVTEDTSESLAAWSTLWQGVKLTGGVWYDLHQHGLPEGFTFDLAVNLFLNSGGTRCTEYAGSGPCLSGDDLEPAQRDVANHLQLNTAFRYTF